MLRHVAARVAVAAAAAAAWPSQDPLAIDAFLERLRTTTDVVWLQQIARSEDFLRDEWRKTVVRSPWDKRYRQDAYLRLGALATPESVEAVSRVETALARRVLAEGIDSGTLWHSPLAGYPGTVLRPTASAIVGDRSYAVVVLEAYGPFATYLLWQDPRDGARWTRPRLAALPTPLAWSFEPALTQDARGLAATFTPLRSLPQTALLPPRAVRFRVDDVVKDTDGDGWTDFEERHLGLDPAHADSDRDGLPDDRDASPTYAPAAGADRDDEAALLRRAVFAAYGLTGSRWALFARSGSRRLQLDGLSGPVVFGVDLPTREDVRNPPAIRGGAQVMWKVAERSADAAVVEFTDWAGTNFKATSRMALRRVHGEWVAVDRRVVSSR